MDHFGGASNAGDEDDSDGEIHVENRPRLRREKEAALALGRFQTLRDKHLEPRPSQELELRINHNMNFYDEENEDMCRHIYRPKNGDYSNLQSFASSIGRFPALYVIISLPEGALVLIHNHSLHRKIQEIMVDGTIYKSTGLLLETASCLDDQLRDEYFVANIFFPRNHASRPRLADGDMVLSVTASWGLACKQGRCTLCITAKEAVNQKMDDYFTPLEFERCMTELSSLGGRELKLRINTLTLPDDWWLRLAPCPLVDLCIYNTPVPAQLWQYTRGKEVLLGHDTRWRARRGKNPYESRVWQWEQSVQLALLGLQSRETPIGKVHLTEAFSWTTPQDTLPLLKALHGTKELVIYILSASQAAWDCFWRSRELADNRTLQQLSFSMVPNVWCEGEPGALLPVIHECLTRNLFLERIQLTVRPRPFRNGTAMAEYWRDNIGPLLEMNGRHEHRLRLDENRHWLLHQRLLQVYNHPKKLFKLLRDHPQALEASLVSERLGDDQL